MFKRGEDVNGWIGLSLRATLERGKDINVHGWAGRAVAGSNIRRRKNTLI
jgi:hypothetical protein